MVIIDVGYNKNINMLPTFTLNISLNRIIELSTIHHYDILIFAINQADEMAIAIIYGYVVVK